VWENCWAAKFAQAVRHANGVLVSQDRIRHDVVVRSIEALEREEVIKMPRRMGRPGLMGTLASAAKAKLLA
jgi:hypothetical protein